MLRHSGRLLSGVSAPPSLEYGAFSRRCMNRTQQEHPCAVFSTPAAAAARMHRLDRMHSVDVLLVEKAGFVYLDNVKAGSSTIRRTVGDNRLWCQGGVVNGVGCTERFGGGGLTAPRTCCATGDRGCSRLTTACLRSADARRLLVFSFVRDPLAKFESGLRQVLPLRDNAHAGWLRDPLPSPGPAAVCALLSHLWPLFPDPAHRPTRPPRCSQATQHGRSWARTPSCGGSYCQRGGSTSTCNPPGGGCVGRMPTGTSCPWTGSVG